MSIKDFMREREKLNKLVFKYGGLNIKRFFNLDSKVYESNALPKKIKELMGLVASIVLRCDDCINYHLLRCYEENVSDGELEEAIAIALIVGGSITIPHIRKVFKNWDMLKKEGFKVDE